MSIFSSFPRDMAEGGQGAVGKTVLEVPEHHHHHQQCAGETHRVFSSDQLLSLISELRRVSELVLLPCDCHHKLDERLVGPVNSKKVLTRPKSVHQASIDDETTSDYTFIEPTDGLYCNGNMIEVEAEDATWVSVAEMVSNNAEEISEIDAENYSVITKEEMIDAIANFATKCIMENTKSQHMTQEELQQAIETALGGTKIEKMLGIGHAGKVLYSLSTWALALAGFHKCCSLLKLAADSVQATSNVVTSAFDLSGV